MSVQMIPATPYPRPMEPFISVAIRVNKRYYPKVTRTPTSLDICAMCPDAIKVSCQGCKLVQYCSEECLRRDLPIHSLFCTDFKQYKGLKRPFAGGIRYRRAILIPENGSPRWTWVTTTPDRLFYCLTPLFKDLPQKGLTQGSESIQLGYHSTRIPRHGLIATMRCQSTRGENQSSINQFLQSQGPPGHLNPIWGPVIVLAYKAGNPDTTHDPRGLLGYIEDVEMADVRHVFHTLVHNMPENPCVVDISRFAHNTITALKVNGVGDRMRFHPDKPAHDDAAIYETVSVHNAPYHPSIQWPSLPAFALGLPWICRIVCGSKDFWVKAPSNGEGGEWVPDGHSLKNPEVGCLHNAFKGYGLAGRFGMLIPPHLDMNDHPGTVLVMHMYGEIIPAEHIKMFRLFCEQVEVMNSFDQPQQADNVFCEDGFRKFWDMQKQENAIPGLDLTGVHSPYAWKDTPHRQQVVIQQDRRQPGKYEKMLEAARTAKDPAVFGYNPTPRPVFPFGSNLDFEEFQRQLGDEMQQ